MTWRYNFIVPVRGEMWVDYPFNPCPRINVPGGPDFILANVPRGSDRGPVYIPWSNISFVEKSERS